MIDMHSHCLPSVDDGAKNVEQSLAMLSESYKQGVRLCAATPHAIIHRQKDLEVFLEDRQRAYEKLKSAIKKDGGEYPDIILGAEVYLDNDLNRYEGLQKLCYTGTNYLLLEFPIEGVNPRWAEWIYEMNRKGLKVLVAHVDRYPHWEKMMADFNGLDVKYQVNASRFIKFSDRKLVKTLLEYGYEYVISSDMHNTKSRGCNMAEAYEKVKKKYPKYAESFFAGNARKILGTKPLEVLTGQ